MHPNLLDQLLVFQEVAEIGSFSAAARRLNRTVSAISYTITQLEEQLDLLLFDRSGYRPKLTKDGQSLLRDAHIIIRKIERFEGRVSSLKEDIAVNTTISIDRLFPIRPLAAALAKFANKYPQIQINIQQKSFKQAQIDVKNGDAQIGIASLRDDSSLEGFDGRQIASREIILVAAKNHPLSLLEEPFPIAQLDDYRQIILSESDIDSIHYGYEVHVTDVWAVDSIQLLKELVSEGVGWAYVTRDMVSEELESGIICRPRCKDIIHGPTMLFVAAWTTKHPPNTILSEFLDLLQVHCQEFQNSSGKPAPSHSKN